MDSCYLCVVGGHQMAGAPGAREGFGTCQQCRVHACALHGDREAGIFRCADCLALRNAQNVIAQPARAGQPAPASRLDRLLLDEYPDAFPALSPRMASSAAQFFLQADRERMRGAVRALLGQLREGYLDLDSLLEVLAGLDLPQVAAAFGLYGGDDEVSLPLAVPGPEMYAAVARRTALLTVDRERLRSPDEIDSLLDLAIWALALAYAARQAESLDEHPLRLRGGALLPPLLLFLALAYQDAGNA
jgi:hypothetical protein